MTPADERNALMGELEGAITSLTPGGLFDTVTAFLFMKSTAITAKIPFAENWHLIYDGGRVWPWRIIDTGIHALEGSTDRVVFVLQSPAHQSEAPGKQLKAEMEAYGHAFRAITEMAAGKLPMDLTCTKRRDAERNANAA